LAAWLFMTSNLVNDLARLGHDSSISLDFGSTLGVNGPDLGSGLEYCPAKNHSRDLTGSGYGVEVETVCGSGIPVTRRGQVVSACGQSEIRQGWAGPALDVRARSYGSRSGKSPIPIYLCASIPEPSISNAITGSYHAFVCASQHGGLRMWANGDSNKKRFPVLIRPIFLNLEERNYERCCCDC